MLALFQGNLVILRASIQGRDGPEHAIEACDEEAGKTWSIKDLEDEQLLTVGLHLLYNRMSGLSHLHLAKSIHIAYDEIPRNFLDKLASKITKEQKAAIGKLIE